MRVLIAVVTTLIVASSAAAQVRRVLPAGPEQSKMLHKYLLAEAQKHFDARRQAVAKLETPQQIRNRQAELKKLFVAALGGFPEKTPLHARVVGTLQGDGFRVEKVIYESRPDHHVTAALYLPQSKSRVPGVLVPCGHSANGKAAEAYQRVCILMAKNGLAVLCYDPIGQGERVQFLKNGKPAIAGSTSEHTMVGVGALLVGGNTATYRIWDGIRSLDYLASRPEVDPQRLGCTGNSGGGTLTAYLMALDDRIFAAAPSCYITSLERLFATIGPQDAEQNITGQVAFGMEHADYLTMRAPKPTLMCVATQDFFDINGAWTTFREATLLYGKLGHGERVGLFEFNDKHGFSKPRREAAMRWMRRWLLHIDDAPSEGDFRVFTDAELQCTRSGQVLEDFQGRSVFHLNAQRSQQLAAQRKQLENQTRLDLASAVLRRIGTRPPSTAKVKDMGVEAAKGYQVFRRVYETEPGILVPAVDFVPEGGKKNDVVLYIGGQGMASGAAAIEKLVSAGRRVLALDLRGIGETAPGDLKKARFFGPDSKEAFLALHLNRPLLGQRVYDLLQVLDAEKLDRIELMGVDSAGPVALHAAVLDQRIQKVTLVRSLTSWSSVVENPISERQLGNVVPGVLKDYDLPDLARALAPAPLDIREAVDGMQHAVSQKELDGEYAACRAAYERLGAAKNLVLQAAR